MGDKEIWAFEHEVCERYIVYGLVVGTGPCATLADAQLKRTDKTSVKPFGKEHHRFGYRLRSKKSLPYES